jgi:hypothetical protein
MSAITNFDFHNIMPGQQLPPVQEVVARGSIMWGPMTHQQFFPGIIDGTSRDAGNTGYTNVLRPGLLLGRVAGTKKYKQFDPTATDGTQKVAAVLLHAVKVQMDSTDRDRFMGYVLIRGGLRTGGIQLASSSNYGIVGNANEWLIRRQMDSRFIFDDMPEGYSFGGSFVDLSAATLTLTELMTGTEVFCTGATAKTITLPASPKRGLRYTVYNTGGADLTLTCATADIMIAYNDATADSVALSTASELIGGSFEVIGTGTAWMVVPRLWEGQTATVAT